MKPHPAANVLLRFFYTLLGCAASAAAEQFNQLHLAAAEQQVRRHAANMLALWGQQKQSLACEASGIFCSPTP